jgi:hypothetical protein
VNTVGRVYAAGVEVIPASVPSGVPELGCLALFVGSGITALGCAARKLRDRGRHFRRRNV